MAAYRNNARIRIGGNMEKLEESINKVDKFCDIATVILPKYSTKIPEYCIDEETWLAIKNILKLVI